MLELLKHWGCFHFFPAFYGCRATNFAEWAEQVYRERALVNRLCQYLSIEPGDNSQLSNPCRGSAKFAVSQIRTFALKWSSGSSSLASV